MTPIDSHHNDRIPCGILIGGLNGAGKTTLARELAVLLGYTHMDIENYAFAASDTAYAAPRTREEIMRLLLADISKHPHFVLSAVDGNFGDELVQYVDLVILLDIRLLRVLSG